MNTRPLNTFDFILNTNDRIMYETALTAITQLELWDFMKNFSGESFMFSNQPEVSQIYAKIEELGYSGHSGTSFGLILRTMQFIANNSFEEFRLNYIANCNNQNNYINNDYNNDINPPQ